MNLTVVYFSAALFICSYISLITSVYFETSIPDKFYLLLQFLTFSCLLCFGIGSKNIILLIFSLLIWICIIIIYIIIYRREIKKSYLNI